MKFAVADGHALELRLAGLGAVSRDVQTQVDVYFSHPCRDFAATDEALRIRQVGPRVFVTYKGPKIDQSTKTRREIELFLGQGDRLRQTFAALIEALGFQPVGTVRKTRRTFQLAWHTHDVLVSIDDVERLGRFTELELLSDERGIDDARAAIMALAEQLDLGPSQRRSYLELLTGD